jgi:hypothetical protein
MGEVAVSAYGRKLRSRSPVRRIGRMVLLAGSGMALAVFLLLPKTQASEASNVQTILQIAQAFGEAHLDRDSNGAPRISTDVDGFPYTMTFFDCSESNLCHNAQFVAHFDAMANPTHLDEWNGEPEGPRAYFDAMGGTSLAQTVELVDAPTPINVMGMIGNWGNAVFDFVALIEP